MAHPWLTRLRDFFASLRPLWWVFRAVVVMALVINVVALAWGVPVNLMTVVVGVVALTLSVQFGRGRWLPFAWMRGALLALNVIPIVAAPFIVASATNAVNSGWVALGNADQSSGDLSSTGLLDNGSQVSNIFAYDAQGHPLTDVQLFDEDGQSGILVPNQQVPGRLGWNVFPLAHVSSGNLNPDGSIKHSVTPTPAKLPFANATPLAGSVVVAPTASPVPTATPTP